VKPIIGVCVNHSYNENAGLSTSLGMNGQSWQMIADDYICAIEKAGGIPMIIPIIEDKQSVIQLVKHLDGILFTGGSDIDPQYYNEYPSFKLGPTNPKRDNHEILLAKHVLFETNMPILGICRGMQLLNIVSGGTLYQDIRTERVNSLDHSRVSTVKTQTVHPIHIREQTRLKNILKTNEQQVNSFNHQAVKELGKDFIVSAEAPDGLIEAIEVADNRFVIGVQWHPEVLIETCEKSKMLFKSFVNSCL